MHRRDLLGAAALGAASVLLPALSLRAGVPPRRASRVAVDEHNLSVLDVLLQPGPPLRSWRWIVIHHTASEHSTKARIDAYHRRKFDDPLGCEYHFLVHNGRKAPEGWIEPARWSHQARSIHLFKPEGAPDAVTVCLVGNFEERRVRARQLDPVTDLVDALCDGLSIPLDRVTTHRRVDGRLTQCPGKRFPFGGLFRRLKRRRESRRD